MYCLRVNTVGPIFSSRLTMIRTIIGIAYEFCRTKQTNQSRPYCVEHFDASDEPEFVWNKTAKTKCSLLKSV